MPIVQTSKIKVRSGLQQNLPQLDKGEFGWAVDTQRLFIGNGNISDGAPFQGNTEVITVVSPAAVPALIPVAGGFQQTPNGTITQFWTAGNVAPIAKSMIVWDNTPLIPGVGYTVSGYIVTFTNPPGGGDHLYWQGLIAG